METVVEGSQEYIWTEASAGGPEERILAALMWQTIVDARAVAKRDARTFLSNAPARMRVHERMAVLEQANRSMKAWVSGPRFRFYCELLGYNPDNAREGVEEILRGGKVAEITRFIRQHGGSKRTDTARSRAGIQVSLRRVRQRGRTNVADGDTLDSAGATARQLVPAQRNGNKTGGKLR